MNRLRTGALITVLALSWHTAVGQTLPSRAPATVPAKPTAATKPVTFPSYLHAELSGTLDAYVASGNLPAAQKRTAALFELAISRAPEKQPDLIRDADFIQRLLKQLGQLPAEKRPELVKYFLAHGDLARALVFTIRDNDPVPAIYDLFDRLRQKRPGQMDAFSNLVAAICIVHFTPLIRNVNEIVVKAADPLDIFDFYVGNEKAMAFGVRNVPPELLKYVVDTTCSIPEMQWALQHYAHDPLVGRHFQDIKYDEDYFSKGTPKKLNSVPYNLPNILQVGGVCADQAYFAASVGKAIGVPTAIAHGASADVNHAWIGFLQAQGNRGAWNFDIGRYEEFKGVRGLVEDPQSRRWYPDAFVSFSAEMINVKPADRLTALALSDAAAYLMALPADAPFASGDLPADMANPPKAIRKPGIVDELNLLKLSLITNPGNSAAWFTLGTLAENGKLSYEQKTEWSNELLKQCGTRYPDFAVAVVSPMIASVDDPAQQNVLWNAAFNRFSNRFDLAAYIRMEQASMWEKQKDFDKAGQCYYDVITRYANAGPFVLNALTGAEKALQSENRNDKILQLYEDTWSRCQVPADMAGEFARESNWFRIGTLLTQKLADAQQIQQAQAVQRIIANKVAGNK